jgi:glutamyl-tRNA synthetase
MQMFTALGSDPPRFAHEALLVGTEGKLSKRLGSLGTDSLREAGIEPQALVALLARLGTADSVDPSLDAEALAASFDLSRFGRAPARFDEQDLERINAAVVHAMPFAQAAPRLPQGMDETAWLAIRPNLGHMVEAADWWQVVTGPVEPPAFDDETRAFLGEAAETLAGFNWSGDVWRDLTASLKESSDRKGKALFQPLRQALTGRDHGPEMAALLPLIGRDAALERLRAATR